MKNLGAMLVVAASLTALPALTRADCVSDCTDGCAKENWANCAHACVMSCQKSDPPPTPDVPKPTPVDPGKDGKKG